MEFIPFARPAIGDAEIEAVTRVMRSGWLTTGQEAAAFEREFAAFVGSPHALAVSSATAGLHLALDALGVGPGDTVAVPSLTFTATAEVVRYLGAEVQFVDITADGFLMDPEALEAALSGTAQRGGRTKAVIVVHLGGEVCAMEQLKRIAARFGARVVEDAAHSLPCRTPAGFAGTLGDVGVFSFYATKTITTGEGGMVCTANDEIARRVRLMRLHGIDREAWDRYQGRGAGWYYQVVEAGYKYNLPDLLAAIGRVQLRRADELADRRREIADHYARELAGLPFLTLPPDSPGHCWHLYMIRVDEARLGMTRDQAIETMRAAGVGCSVHYVPLHMMPYYAQRYRLQPQDYPQSAARFAQTLSLPIYPDLTRAQLDRICSAVRALQPGTMTSAQAGAD